MNTFHHFNAKYNILFQFHVLSEIDLTIHFLHNIAHCVFWSQWILSTISMPSIIYKWSNAICQLFTRYTDNPKAVQSNNRRQIFKKKTISHNVKKAGRPLFSPGIIQIFFFCVKLFFWIYYRLILSRLLGLFFFV